MSGPAPKTAQSMRQVFRMPVLLYALTAVGLASALLGDGMWDVLSWCTLGAPVAVIVWALQRREPRD